MMRRGDGGRTTRRVHRRAPACHLPCQHSSMVPRPPARLVTSLASIALKLPYGTCPRDDIAGAGQPSAAQLAEAAQRRRAHGRGPPRGVRAARLRRGGGGRGGGHGVRPPPGDAGDARRRDLRAVPRRRARQEPKRPLLVHCATANRVGGLLLPYFLIDEQMPEQAALAARAGDRAAERRVRAHGDRLRAPPRGRLTRMLLRRFYDDRLAQASFLVGCQATGEAIVIDPNRDAQQYLDAAREEKVRIIHGDRDAHPRRLPLREPRARGARGSAAAALQGRGAPTGSTPSPPPRARRSSAKDRASPWATSRFEVWHTPGHTPEHLTFFVTDTPATDRPMGAFTGDFVFAGDVGRPDLLERAAHIAGHDGVERARALPVAAALPRAPRLPAALARPRRRLRVRQGARRDAADDGRLRAARELGLRDRRRGDASCARCSPVSPSRRATSPR